MDLERDEGRLYQDLGPGDTILEETFGMEGRYDLPSSARWEQALGAMDEQQAFTFRKIYRRKSFPVLTRHNLERIADLSALSRSPVVEIAAGQGWLSYWGNRLGFFRSEEVCDSRSWMRHFEGQFPHSERRDAVECVLSRRGQDACFMLSWPPMDDLALRVWSAMSRGQHLLLIGEGPRFGSVGTPEFFAALETGGDLKGCNSRFDRFPLIHDYPALYSKR